MNISRTLSHYFQKFNIKKNYVISQILLATIFFFKVVLTVVVPNKKDR